MDRNAVPQQQGDNKAVEELKILQLLFPEPWDTPKHREDHRVMLEISGRRIGHGRNRDVLYIVYDGYVYAMNGEGTIGRVDYFDFCQVLRDGAEANREMDFQPVCNFHLGWPKIQSEKPLQQQSGGAGESNAKQESQVKREWTIRLEDGRIIRSFNNTHAALNYAANANGAIKFDSYEKAVVWGDRYASGYAWNVVPVDSL